MKYGFLIQHIIISILGIYTLATAFGVVAHMLYLTVFMVTDGKYDTLHLIMDAYFFIGGIVYSLLVVVYVFKLLPDKIWHIYYLILFAFVLAMFDGYISQSIVLLTLNNPLKVISNSNYLFSISLIIVPFVFACLLAIEIFNKSSDSKFK